MENILVRELFKNSEEYYTKEIKVSGWIRTVRDSKTFGFIELNDVDSFKTLDKIAAVRTHKPFSDMPYEPVVIEKMVVSEDEPSNPVEKIED